MARAQAAPRDSKGHVALTAPVWDMPGLCPPNISYYAPDLPPL